MLPARQGHLKTTLEERLPGSRRSTYRANSTAALKSYKTRNRLTNTSYNYYKLKNKRGVWFSGSSLIAIIVMTIQPNLPVCNLVQLISRLHLFYLVNDGSVNYKSQYERGGGLNQRKALCFNSSTDSSCCVCHHIRTVTQILILPNVQGQQVHRDPVAAVAGSLSPGQVQTDTVLDRANKQTSVGWVGAINLKHR